MPDFNHRQLAERLIATAQAAGRAEMEIYRQDFEVDTKHDASPVTQADRAGEKIILDSLAAFAPDIPVVAEEAASEGRIPDIGERFFLVDPLDGTKEFIRKSNEFTVNIALIERGAPVFGIVYAPAMKKLFVTLGPEEAAMAELETDNSANTVAELSWQTLATSAPKGRALAIVASKSHMTEETKRYLEQFEIGDFKSAGSSLKFCLLAQGEADMYPRFGPTMEWDTAAGHAVLKAAGGVVVTTDGAPLGYGKVGDGYRNPFFIAWACEQETESRV